MTVNHLQIADLLQTEDESPIEQLNKMNEKKDYIDISGNLMAENLK